MINEKLTAEELEQQRISKLLAKQNDEFRQNILTGRPHHPGTVVTTRTLMAYGKEFVRKALQSVCNDHIFNRVDDLWEEHDLGFLSIDGQMIIWKIDYYDNDMEYHSPDKTDPTQTYRVMTIMHQMDW